MEQLLSLKSALNLPRIGAGKSIWLGVVAALVLGAIAFVALKPSSQMGLLYAGLDPAEAGKVGQKLDELKIPYQVTGDGGTILVPVTQVPKTRMELAADGLPHQGGAGYELLDQQSPMNMTSFMQRVQRVRALEGELARTIATLNGVKSARIHLVLPEREGFSRDVPKPTASVTVTMEGPGRLSPSQAAAVRLLVAGAVPRMQQEDVSVLDPSGIVLAADGGAGSTSQRIETLQSSQEQTLQARVMALLEPLVGPGKVRVAASVQLSTDRETERDQKFDPLSQVERSKQTENNRDSSDESKGQQAVTVGQNIPNQQPNAGAGNQNKNSTSSSHTTETVNYEISSTMSEKVREPGELERQTVAVVVDGTLDDKGNYTPRSQEELDRLKALVQSAVGYNDKRGDTVTVETMRFINQNSGDGVSSDQFNHAVSEAIPMKIAIPAGAGVVVLLALLGFLLMRGRGGKEAALLAGPDELRLAGGAAGAAAGTDAMLADADDLFSISAVGGKPRNPALQSLNNVVDSQPEEALAVLRNWIIESGAT